MLHQLGRRLAERLRIRRDIRRLERLDDYLLADIGVERTALAGAVRGRR